MAVSVVGTPSVQIADGGSYTAETGTNRAVVFTVNCEHPASPVTALTFGGVSATKAADRSEEGAGVDVYAGVWYILESSIPTGSQTIALTGGNNDTITAITLAGVDQTTPVYGTNTDGNSVGGGDASIDISLGTAIADGIAIATGIFRNAGSNVANNWTGSTTLVAGSDPGLNYGEVVAYKPTTGATESIQFTNNTNQWNAGAAVSFAPASSGSTVSGVGASAGTSAVSGVGQSTSSTVGASVGIAAVTGVGSSISQSVAQSAGTSLVDGIGTAVFQSVASSAGTSAVSGVGQFTTDSVGSSVGIASVSGVGSSLSESVASSSGLSAANAAGQSTADSVGASSGTSVVSGVGSSSLPGEAVATSAGTSIAYGVGQSIHSSVASSSGISVVSGASSTTSVVNAVALSAGTSNVVGISTATPAARNTGGGKGARKRHRQFANIDGNLVEVYSYKEALSLINKFNDKKQVKKRRIAFGNGPYVSVYDGDSLPLKEIKKSIGTYITDEDLLLLYMMVA